MYVLNAVNAEMSTTCTCVQTADADKKTCQFVTLKNQPQIEP